MTHEEFLLDFCDTIGAYPHPGWLELARKQDARDEVTKNLNKATDEMNALLDEPVYWF